MKTSLFSNPLSTADLKNRKIPDGKEFVLKGFSRGNIGFLIANEGAGKSGLAHLISIDIACGTNMSGLSPAKGKVLYISLEDRELIWSKRQREIEKDLTIEQIQQAEKNIQVHDLKEYSHTLSANPIYHDLFIHCQEFKPDLVIIDYLEKFAQKELTDVPQAQAIGKSIENMAIKLNCGFLFLHHTTKSANEEEVGIRGMSAGATQFGRVVKWRVLLKDDRKRKNYSLLLADKSDEGKFTIPYVRRNDRMGIPYCSGSPEEINLVPESDKRMVDLDKIGGKYPSNKVVPMSAALLKKDGVFGSFAPNQPRPKLDVKIELDHDIWVHIMGRDMLGALDGKILLAIVAKINESGVRLCLPNKTKLYDNVIERIEDNCNYTMEINTTINQLYKILNPNKDQAGKNIYNAIRKSIIRLRTSAVVYRNKGRESVLNLLEHYYYEDETKKVNIRINPFLVDAILGIGGVSFTKIPMKIVQTIDGNHSFILYQRIKSIVRNVDRSGVLFKIETLLTYLYPTNSTQPGIRKDRCRSLKIAINELNEKTEFSFKKEGKFHWRVTPRHGT